MRMICEQPSPSKVLLIQHEEGCGGVLYTYIIASPLKNTFWKMPSHVYMQKDWVKINKMRAQKHWPALHSTCYSYIVVIISFVIVYIDKYVFKNIAYCKCLSLISREHPWCSLLWIKLLFTSSEKCMVKFGPKLSMAPPPVVSCSMDNQKKIHRHLWTNMPVWGINTRC